ncbi:MAG: ATP-dependent DNA helicase, partial [Acidobacteria bacterium]|nr:ATP-dependent DNA helicase [Acidobacteriota bacterium]
MPSPAEVAGLFAPGGPLARSRQSFEHRAGQERMAGAVARAFAEGRHLVVEAGTGTGKTLAYLVPALLADEPVLLSTGTKALQDQLLERELPVARAATGVEREVAVLKGRENYLCLKRLEELTAEPRLDLAAEVPLWPKLTAWAETTPTGDRAELAELPDASPLWSRVDGRAEICTGTKCPRFEGCWVYRARRIAARAQAVVVNHHLLFADLALRRSERGGVLPAAPLAVLDEAHLVEEAAAAHFGRRLTARMASELVRDARHELERTGGRVETSAVVEQAARAFFRAARPPGGAPGRVALDPERARGDLRRLADVLLDAL